MVRLFRFISPNPPTRTTTTSCLPRLQTQLWSALVKMLLEEKKSITALHRAKKAHSPMTRSVCLQSLRHQSRIYKTINTSRRLHQHISLQGEHSIKCYRLLFLRPPKRSHDQLCLCQITISVSSINAWCNCILASPENKRRKLIFAISEIPPERNAASCNYRSKVSLLLLSSLC